MDEDTSSINALPSDSNRGLEGIQALAGAYIDFRVADAQGDAAIAAANRDAIGNAALANQTIAAPVSPGLFLTQPQMLGLALAGVLVVALAVGR